MTTQISNLISYKDKQFTLVSWSNSQLFNPISYGLNPVMMSTGCYIGYVIDYKIENDLLTLDNLWINHQEDGLSASQQNQAPILNGVEAKVIPDNHMYYGWGFEAVGLPLKYTGNLTIARNTILESCTRGSIFLEASNFEEVYTLIFESGKLVSESNISKNMELLWSSNSGH